jgi:hypothetical protein
MTYPYHKFENQDEKKDAIKPIKDEKELEASIKLIEKKAGRINYIAEKDPVSLRGRTQLGRVTKKVATLSNEVERIMKYSNSHELDSKTVSRITDALSKGRKAIVEINFAGFIHSQETARTKSREFQEKLLELENQVTTLNTPKEKSKARQAR